MGSDCSMCRKLNILDAFWMNQIQVRHSVLRKIRVGGGLWVLLGPWLILGVSSLSVLGFYMRFCTCLFLCIVVRK